MIIIIHLQQFLVPKFTSSRLANFNFNITRTLSDLKRKGEIVSLADSQALRTIRKIRYERNPDITQFNQQELDQLKSDVEKLKRKITPETRQAISNKLKQIDDMLYIPEYLTIVMEQNNHYKKIIKDGFYFNNHKYVRLLCGAAHARVNTVCFIREDFEIELKTRLRNGITEDDKGFFRKSFDDAVEPLFKITANKYSAYFALSSTATYLVTTPKCVCIDDCEIKMTKKVDWVENTNTDDPLENINKIVTCEKELDFNLFDGGGIIDISLARQWAKDLELDYIPSVFIVRNIFIKGCLFVMDIHKFRQEVAHTNLVTDLWNKVIDISDKNVILTKSMFKLWNAYSSMEQYQECCDKFGNLWGISRVPPKIDNDCITTNYQFCQVFNFDTEDVEGFCKPTIDWLTGVSGLDRNQALLFSMGSLANKHYDDIKTDLFDKIGDNITKALIVNPNMIQDEYIRQTMISAINKKIKEAYIGKLIINGNFQVMIPDPYALLEWAFADGDAGKVHGLLNEFEHYSAYWNARGADKVISMRSPLTWRSETNLLHLKNDEKTREWYKYLYSGIVYNVWGCDCMIHADGDFDGDIVCSTNNPEMLKCKHYDETNCLPITYEKVTVPKSYMREKDLWKSDIRAFNSTIGTVTNYSTSFYDLLCKYKGKDDAYSKRCYNEILERLKLTRKAQGDSIDKAKGVQVDDYPSHWIYKQIIQDTDDEDTVAKKKFLNDICANRKPYFFYYRYPACKSDYDDFVSKKRRYAAFISNRDLNSIIDDPDENELEFANDYHRNIPLIDYNSPMNKICHWMEDNLKEISLSNIAKTPQDVISLMITGDSTEEETEKIKELYKLYAETKRMSRINADINIDQYSKELRKEALSFFKSTEQIANATIKLFYIDNYSQGKSFAWNVFGKYILDNIITNTKTKPSVPILDAQGDITYLYKKYKEVEFDI